MIKIEFFLNIALAAMWSIKFRKSGVAVWRTLRSQISADDKINSNGL